PPTGPERAAAAQMASITSGMLVENIQIRNSARYATADAKPVRRNCGYARNAARTLTPRAPARTGRASLLPEEDPRPSDRAAAAWPARAPPPPASRPARPG